MTPEAVVALLGRRGVDAELVPLPPPPGVRCRCAPERLLDVLRALRDEAGFALLSSITAVDEGEHIRLLYHLVTPVDPEFSGFACVEIRPLKGDHPDGPIVPSAVDLYPGANLQEREIYDLMGVRFRGHPKLTRVLTWPGFRGHPLRKDYEPIDEEIPWRLAGLRGPDGSLLDEEEARRVAWETDEWEEIPVDAPLASGAEPPAATT